MAQAKAHSNTITCIHGTVAPDASVIVYVCIKKTNDFDRMDLGLFSPHSLDKYIHKIWLA